ncbi:MAG: hypothetical protein PHC70_02645 [Patescibacteria group bacterium]|nr:hypothetical protein [Patescibacteria group bacterium]
MPKVYSSFSDLPENIQNFLLHDADAVFNDLIDSYNLPEDGYFDGIDAPILDSVMGLATFEQALARIGGYLMANVKDRPAQQDILVRLLSQVFWPLRDVYGNDLIGFLQEEKVDTSGWTQKKILFKPLSYNGAVSELVNHLGLYSSGQQERTKLKDLLVSFVKGVRVADQLKEIMVRPAEMGGLGFDQKMADKAVNFIKELNQTVKILDEKSYSDYLASEMQPARTQELKDVNIPTQEVDQQIETIKAKLPPPPRAITELDKAVAATLERIPSKPTDEYLANRLQNVISSRLRDVRNSSELLGLLQRDSKVGGMGLDKAAADDMSKIIETSYEEFRQKIESEEKGKLEVQLTEQKKKIEEKRKREAEEHAKWYEEKIKKRQAGEAETKQVAEAIKKGFESKIAAHPVDLKNAAIEKKQFGELVPAPAVKKIQTQLSKPQEQAKTVKVSTVTAAAAKIPSLRVDGVQRVSAAPKLSGLADEVGGMTLQSFRRLAKTPQEAAAKMKQRFDTLGEEGFEQKTTAIKAWQRSPLMKMYLDLVTQSFKAGKPIVEIAEERRKAGEDTLTRDEVEVLIDLNNNLHY